MPASEGPGELLRRLRREQRITLAELARRAFYSKGYLSKVENGEKPLTQELAGVCDEVLATGGLLVRSLPPAGRGAGGEARDSGACPYLGLSSFGVRDARWFFGRKAAVADLVSQLTERLRAPGPLLVMAPSGAGKSSLLRAGLLPALARGVLPVTGSQVWPIVLLTPGSRPLGDLLDRIAAVTGASHQVLEKAVQEGRDALAVAVSAAVDAARAPAGPGPRDGGGARGTIGDEDAALVLVVDQFEETFMLCSDESEQEAFVQALLSLTKQRTPGKGLPSALVVIGVRSDFYERCLGFPGLAAAMQRGHMTMGPMDDAQLREAITGPAREAGLELEPGLVEILLRDIGLLHGRAVPARTGPGGALPLLSHALLSTWQHRENATLTVDGYRLTGGISGAVAATAERAYASLPSHQQEIVRHVLLYLVQLGEGRHTSRAARRTELLEAGADHREDADAVIEAFTRARLLTVDAEHVEVAHEVLLDAWPRLRQWIEEDRSFLQIRQTLAEAAATWEKEGHDPTLLYRGPRLAAALEAAENPRTQAAITSTGRTFLQAGADLDASQRRLEQRRLRRLRALTAGLAILLVLSLVAGAMAFQQSRVADNQSRVAGNQRRIAESRELAARADGMMREKPEAAMLLALSAYRRSPTTEARSSLISTYAQYPGNQLTGHTDDMWAVAFSPDSRLVVTASDDHTAKLWDTVSGGLVTTFAGHTDRVAGVVFSPDGRLVATAGRDRTAKLWDAITHRLVATLTGHSSGVNSVAFSSDGRTLASASDDGTIRLWDVGTHRQAALLSSGSSSVRRVAFSPDGRTLAAAYSDQKVRLWDMATRRVKATLAGHTNAVMAVVFSPDGRMLATGSSDRTARLWDMKTYRSTATFSGHADLVWSLAFSPDGRTLATASFNDDTVRLWNTTTHEAAGTLTGDGLISAVAFSPDGQSLVTTSETGQRGVTPTLQLWNASTHKKSRTLTGSAGSATAVAISPDGRVLAAGDSRGSVLLWDIARRSLVTTLTGHTNTITSVVFSPDGRTLATTSDDGTARLWDTRTHRETATLRGHSGSVRAAAFSPDGLTLATAGADHSTRLWDTRSHQPVAVLGGEPDAVGSVAFSPDGRTLATGSHDTTVRLWNLRSRTVIATLDREGQMCRTYSLAFSPDGRTLAATSCDVTLWNSESHQRVTRLTGHTDTTSRLAYAPDGRTLATAGYDRTIRLWNTQDHQLLSTLTGTGGYVSGLAYAPTGRLLATTNTDRTIRLWELDPASVGKRICELSRDHHWHQTITGSSWENPCS
ncbi:nSTAND1 domain-containing NTPase [Streptomyces roseoverticillatus]|uniref:Helix-turn-helix domain-containing protein n=1 Tax=Streptomyces roseoverticillatus TaxID=66429 RepID=A0ABV3IV44_9ACTN